MDNLLTKITNILLKQKSVVLVGQTQAGKSHWVEHELIPNLEKDKKVVYFKEATDIKPNNADIFIFDEAETLFDKEFLEEKHPEENPYYTLPYLEKVKSWHESYKKFDGPSLYVMTRNSEQDINNLVQNFTCADWDNREVLTIKFSR